MDSTEVNDNPNPRENANIFSILFFGYTIPIFRKGLKKELDVEDVYNTLSTDQSDLLYNRLEVNWNKEIENSKSSIKNKPSLLKAIAKTFWPEYLWLGILNGFADLVLKTNIPFMLGGILDYYAPGSTKTKFEANLYGLGLVSFTLLNSICINQYLNNSAHAGMKVRSAVCALIYKKATRLSRTALGDTPAGKVVNLLSNDVARFDFASSILHQMWIGPISGIIVMFMLYQRIGFSALAGILVIVFMIPLQVYSGRLAGNFRDQTALKTDERIRLMDEVILGIQVIKMYAWEIPFQRIISLARKAEIKIIQKSSFVRAFFTTLGLATTRIALFATLVTVVLSQEEINASKVFVLMSYFNLLSITLVGFFIRGVTEIAELFISISRLQHFMENEEYKYVQLNNTIAKRQNTYNDILTVKNLTAKWNASVVEPVLKNINLNVKRGKLIGVIGTVGSGKSSLLQCLLGELHITMGSIEANGSYSYTSQEPWIFAATIRQNILFGAEYDKNRFKEVIKVCALEKDLEQFENGDLTIVGDKGASLSGGQKARINLARAVYRNKDIYLLDDPLSAVDIHVSKTIYEQCINGFLETKTKILVTHQVHYLKNADHIIILNNGCIENEGTFNDLANSDNLYAKLLTTEQDMSEEPKIKQIDRVKSSRSSIRSRASIVSLISELSDLSLENSHHISLNFDEDQKAPKMIDMLEETSKGKVTGSLLLQYFQTGANCFNVAGVLVLYFLAQIAANCVDYWISVWTTIEEFRVLSQVQSLSSRPFENVTEIPSSTPQNTKLLLSTYPNWSTETCLYIYGTLTGVVLISILGRSFSFYSLAMSCSKKLHQHLFEGIIYARMRFFDTNPSGRVLNRFARDIGSIDEVIPRILLDGGQRVLQIIGSLVLIGIANPYAIVLAVALAVMTAVLRNIYLRTSQNLKRIEGRLRSPIFTHLNATLQGLPTIRALKTEEILQAEFNKIQNYHISSWFMNISCEVAFGFSLDLLSCIFITVLVFSILTFDESMGLTGGTIGLAINQASALTGMIQISMKMTADIANQLMSVERVLQYKQLPKEPQPLVPKTLPKSWPKSGKIDFERVKLRYFEDGPLIINDITLQIKPKEKVGVVGRTGAGKSSLIAALFRLADIEGKIAIDDIETKDISLKDLRSQISIIPQDPVLFSGTLRYNLDPFNEYSDEILYKALQEVELKDPANITNQLGNRVLDRGSNYSVGQRQLICLARAIVRNNKILMLDEATANVDPQTDGLIQKTIRTKFADCTVLTVAHRLNTIMDSNKVLVMEHGKVAEFDHPHLLLQNPNGIFSRMVEDTGFTTREQLRRIAKDSYKNIATLQE